MAKRKTKPKPVNEPGDTPTHAQLEKGSYERKFVTHVETNTKSMAFVSSHDPVERWLRDGRLSDSQEVAILAVRRLWGILGHVRKVTATYGERIGGNGSAEYGAINELEAKQDLARIEGYFTGLKTWWNVFENVCRWNMAAGTAGSELGFGTRGAEIRAHTVVCFVADKICEQERW